MRGPSIRGEEVRTRKQRAAQHRVSSIHWVLLSGFRMAVGLKNTDQCS
jgi:hypothetical protein